MTEENQITTISLWQETKDKLDSIKIHHQQSYDDLLKQLIKEHLEIDSVEKYNKKNLRKRNEKQRRQSK